MRPIKKGQWPTKAAGRKRIFNNWTRAIPFLKLNTGNYCHLCEMRVTNAIAIEHIKPKEHFPKLENHWDNFLLVCNYCNSHKSDQIPVAPYRKKYFWPHLNNTFNIFEYSFSGYIDPNKAVLNTQNSIQRAQNLIDIYGLNKVVTTTGNSDNRWLERLEAIALAAKRRVEYDNCINTSIDAIVDFAKIKGNFSIWLKTFDDIPAVRTALINCPDFHIPISDCFDQNLVLKNRTTSDF